MQTTQQNGLGVATRTHLSAYVEGLILFAEQNPSFKKELIKTTTNIISADERLPAVTPSPLGRYCIPRNNKEALRRLDWLSYTLQRAPLLHTAARSRIETYADTKKNTRQDPQDVVLGIVGLAIIGPTLGLIKKNELTKMCVVLRNDLEEDEVHTCAHQLPFELLSLETQQADGNVYRIEPTLADWFYGERKTSFHMTDRSSLENLVAQLDSEGIRYATKRTGDAILGIALPPSIDEHFLQSFRTESVQLRFTKKD